VIGTGYHRLSIGMISGSLANDHYRAARSVPLVRRKALEAQPATARAEIAATGSEKRLRPAGSTSGDAMAEAFRRAGLAPKTPGRQ